MGKIKTYSVSLEGMKSKSTYLETQSPKESLLLIL